VSLVIMVEVGESNLGGCVAGVDEGEMKDGMALL
jgi:hypothetical protein